MQRIATAEAFTAFARRPQVDAPGWLQPVWLLIPGLVLAVACLHPMLVASVLPVGFGDQLAFYYPFGRVIHLAMSMGQVPFWNPWQFSGLPFFADPSSAYLYPANLLLYRFVDVSTVIRSYFFLHVVLAYAGMVLYLRGVGLGRWASIYGGLAYAFSDYLFIRIGHLPLLTFASWIPLLFALVDRVLAARSSLIRLAYMLALAGAVAADVLAGFYQGLYYSLAALCAYFLVVSVKRTTFSLRGVVGEARAAVVVLGLPLLAAVGLSAVQILPTLEFLRATNLSLGYPSDQVYGGADINDLSALLGAVGSNEVTSLYTGALALVLAPLALALRPNRRTLFWGGMILLSFALAGQGPNPVRQVASVLLPGWHALSQHMPERVLILAVFAFACLSAWAIDGVARRAMPLLALSGAELLLLILLRLAAGVFPPGELSTRLASDGVTLAIAFLAGNVLLLAAFQFPGLRWRSTGLLAPALAGLLVLDLLGHKQVLGLRYASPDEHFASSPAASYLLSHDPTGSRFFSSRPSLPNAGYYDADGSAGFLVANAATVYGLQDTQGYNPLHLARYGAFLDAINQGVVFDYHVGVVRNFFSPLLKYLGTRYFITDNNLGSVGDAVTLVQAVSLANEHSRVDAPINTPGSPMSELTVDSALANAALVSQGTAVGQVDVIGMDGSATSFVVRAGLETAEWAHDRPDVLAVVQHERAPVAKSWPADGRGEGHFYRAVLHLPAPTTVRSLRLTSLLPQVDWSIDQISTPLPLVDAYTAAYQDERVRIFEARQTLPRAWLVHHAEQIADGQSILERLSAPEFDPRASVVLEKPPEAATMATVPTLVAAGEWAHSDASAPQDEAVQVLNTDFQSERISVQAQQAGILVVSDIYYPAWNAYVDNQPAHVYRADFTLRGVAVPSGNHIVEFRYESALLQIGGALSLITALVLVTCLVFVGRRSNSRVVNSWTPLARHPAARPLAAR